MTRFKIVETIKKTNSGAGTVRAILTTIDGEQCYAVQREGHARFRRRSETAGAISGDLAAAQWANGLRYRRAAYERRPDKISPVARGPKVAQVGSTIILHS
jgi:hypothetical protein